MNYGNKTTGTALLTSTGFALWKSWLLAAVIIGVALGVILYRHKAYRIK